MSGDNSEGPVYSATYSDAADRTQTALGAAKDAVRAGVDAVSAQFPAGRERVARAVGSVEDEFAAVTSDLESRIKKNPLAAVAIAALMGLLIGTMSKTPHSSDAYRNRPMRGDSLSRL